METVTEILVDISGSMRDIFPAVKQALINDILPELDFSSRIGIKTFSTVNPNKQLSIISVLPLSKTDQETIQRVVNSLNCSDGHTPIAASIHASVKSLAEYTANDKVIIILTDGLESEGGNIVLAAEKATTEGINCKIHYVGINLSEKAIAQAKEITEITGGTPSFIIINKDGKYDKHLIRKNLAPLYQAVKPIQTVPSVYPQSGNHSIPPITKVAESKIKEETKAEVLSSLVIEESKIAETENPTLELIVEQIKELRKEIAELKKGKAEIPEIIEDAELNEKIRKASEEYLYEILKRKYPNRVKWLNENGESGKDHDFEILELDGRTIEYFIECKGTATNKTTFLVTKDEWRLFLNHTKNYQIYFVQNSFTKPTHVFIDNLLDWIMKGKIAPYLRERDVIKEGRVVLTIIHTTFED